MPRRFATAGEGSVWSLASVRMDGRTLLARGGADGVIRLIDALDGYTVRSLEPPHQGPVRALLALPNGASGEIRLASGAVDGSVRLWNLTADNPPHDRRFLTGEVWALTYMESGGGIKLVGTGSGGHVQIWDPERDQVQPASHDGGSSSAWALTNVPLRERSLLAAGGADGSIRLWDPVSATTVQVIEEAHKSTVWSLTSIEVDGRTFLASGGADAMVCLWNPITGELVRRFAGHDSTVRVVIVIQTDHGPRLASGSADSTIRVWNPSSAATVPEHSFENRGEIWALAQLDMGDHWRLAGGGASGAVWQFDLETRQQSRLLGGVSNTIWALASVPHADRTLLASGGVAGTIRIIDLKSDDERDLAGHESTVRALASVLGDGPALLASGGADGSVRLWDMARWVETKQLEHAHVGEVWSLTSFQSGGGRFVASGGADGRVRLWRADDASVEARTVGDHGGEIYALTSVNAEGRIFLVCGGPQGRIDVMDVDGGRTTSFDSLRGTVWAFAGFTFAQSWRVACALADGSVVLFDPLTRRSAGMLGDTGSRVRTLQTVEIDGQILIAGGCHDGVVRLWDPVARRKVADLPAHTGTVRGLAVVRLDNNVQLVSAGDDGSVILHELSELFVKASDTASARPTSQITSDQPSRWDVVGRETIVNGLRDFLTDDQTVPPVVVGVHGPWGEGKSTVLMQLRDQLDSQPVPETGDAREPTHRMVWESGGSQERITPWWALKRLTAYGSRPTRDLVARLEPIGSEPSQRITVWFSPWMYNSREELWAGLCQEIIKEVTGRLSVEHQRRLWFELNLRRSDPVVVRRRVLLAFVPHTPWGVAGALAAVALVAVALMGVGSAVVENPRWAAAFVGFPALGLLIKILWTAMRGSVNDVLPAGMLTGPTLGGVTRAGATKPAPEATGDPLHESRAGYLYLVQHDIGQIVGMATARQPVTVFIDDLDRCSSDMINETIEAVNLFVNNVFGQCNFVIAVDPVTVAAHIEGANEAVLSRIATDPDTYGPLSDVGWRFMEKIINLPVRLPRLFDDPVKAYAQNLLMPTERFRHRVVPGATPIDPLLTGGGLGVRPLVVSAPGAAPEAATAGFASQGAAVASADPSGQRQMPRPRREDHEGGGPSRAEHVKRAGTDRLATANTLTTADTGALVELASAETAHLAASEVLQVEDIQQVVSALTESILRLPRRSPREIKRFVNLWRFYLYLEHLEKHLVGNVEELTRHAMAVAWLVEIMLRWPKYLDRFAGRLGDGLVLSMLAKAAHANDQWAEAAELAGLNQNDHAVVELCDLLRATDESTLTAVARRYL